MSLVSHQDNGTTILYVFTKNRLKPISEHTLPCTASVIGQSTSHDQVCVYDGDTTLYNLWGLCVTCSIFVTNILTHGSWYVMLTQDKELYYLNTNCFITQNSNPTLITDHPPISTVAQSRNTDTIVVLQQDGTLSRVLFCGGVLFFTDVGYKLPSDCNVECHNDSKFSLYALAWNSESLWYVHDKNTTQLDTHDCGVKSCSFFANGSPIVLMTDGRVVDMSTGRCMVQGVEYLSAGMCCGNWCVVGITYEGGKVMLVGEQHLYVSTRLTMGNCAYTSTRPRIKSAMSGEE